MELLMELYKISSPSKKEKDMIRFITNRLEALSISYEVDKYGNIYAKKGNSDLYPCIVAHTDEVHPKRSKGYEVIKIKDEIILGYDNNLKQIVGIGADDKNGIWICLKCLEEFEHLKCVFFMGEEVGCIGSNRANMAFFDDCRYVLQCDRKGNGDLITVISGVKLCSDDFINDINISEYGYTLQEGLQTDVAILKQRGLEVSCVNISCGYYNPHTNEEYTRIIDIRKCHDFVRHIINDCTHVYNHEYRNFYHGLSGRYTYPHYNISRYCIEDDEPLKPKERSYYNRMSWENQYIMLLDILSRRLVADESLTVDDLWKIYKNMFPELTRRDFVNAYHEIMGIM